jgi:hypothetical protein
VKRGQYRVLACFVILLMGSALFMPGCGKRGPRPVPVSGVVTIDGKPLKSGFVRVVPDSGRPAGGRIGPDGHFTLGCFTDTDGCLPGTHKAEVQAFEDLSEIRRKWLVPKKYAGTGTSGLTATIDGPTDALKINLTWAGSGEAGPFIEDTPREFRGGRKQNVQGNKP